MPLTCLDTGLILFGATKGATKTGKPPRRSRLATYREPMAAIEPRANKDGSTTYRVRWRKGGARNGKREGEPFDDLTAAEDFAAAVDRAGQEWPWGYVPGIGWNAKEYAALVAGQDAPAVPVETFADYADKWIGRRTRAEPRTRFEYREAFALHVNPTFGAADIADEAAISEDTVSDWVIALLAGSGGERPLAPSTVRRLHGLLSGVLKAAVRTRRRTTNPCEFTELPPKADDEEEMAFLTRQEFHFLLTCANPDIHDLLTVLVNTGLRWSEVSALQVRDVKDLFGPRPYLRVHYAWKRQPKSRDNGPRFELGRPKSKRSRRNVSINKTIVEILIGLVVGKSSKDHLFTTPTGAVWRHSNFYANRWKATVYRAIRCEGHRLEDGLKRVNGGGVGKKDLKPCGCPGLLEKVVRSHDLRHTHASWLIADGAPLTAIQRRLGHQSIQTTSDRYGHLLPEVDEALVGALEARWKATRPTAGQAVPAYGVADYLLEIRTDLADAETEYFEAYQAWRDAGSPDPASSPAAAALRERIDDAHQLVQEARAELDRTLLRTAVSAA